MTSAAALQPLENLIQKRAISRVYLDEDATGYFIDRLGCNDGGGHDLSNRVILVGKVEHSKIPAAFSTQQAMTTSRSGWFDAGAGETLAKMSTQNIAPPKLAFTF